MKVLGLDGSTTSSGYALTVDGVPELCGRWKPPSKIKTQREKVRFMGQQAKSLMTFTRPDLVVIEECGRPPKGNVKVMRALVRVEAVFDYEAGILDIDGLLVAVSAVRGILFDDDKMGKETVYARLSEVYPQFDWLDFGKGGDDMSDALAMSLVGPKLRDRR